MASLGDHSAIKKTQHVQDDNATSRHLKLLFVIDLKLSQDWTPLVIEFQRLPKLACKLNFCLFFNLRPLENLCLLSIIQNEVGNETVSIEKNTRTT